MIAMSRTAKWFPIIILFLTVLTISTAAVPVSADEPLTQYGFFFDTVISVSLYDTADEKIMEKCFDLMQYYESIFSRTAEESDIWNINHSGGQPVAVSGDTIDILEKALYYCELSHGALDITIAPAVDLWNFKNEETGTQPSLPDEGRLAEAVSHVDYQLVQIDGNTVTLKDSEAAIDLGAIAKGYISDKIRELLLENGCESALIYLGGNVCVVGSKPGGSPFKIGVQKPFGETQSELSAVVPAINKSVITSGTYERYFMLDGQIYHHILDPETGYPVRNGLTSVTIYTESGTAGDSLSTACFGLGLEKGMSLIETLPDTEAMFILEDGTIACSSGWPSP